MSDTSAISTKSASDPSAGAVQGPRRPAVMRICWTILLHWLEEMPESITAAGRDSIVRGIHDVAFLTLQFPSGIVANVELSWLAPSKLRRTAIVGSNKMVLYEDGSGEPVRVFDRGVAYGSRGTLAAD